MRVMDEPSDITRLVKNTFDTLCDHKYFGEQIMLKEAKDVVNEALSELGRQSGTEESAKAILKAFCDEHFQTQSAANA